jgi:hypothetical protein
MPLDARATDRFVPFILQRAHWGHGSEEPRLNRIHGVQGHHSSEVEVALACGDGPTNTLYLMLDSVAFGHSDVPTDRSHSLHHAVFLYHCITQAVLCCVESSLP